MQTMPIASYLAAESVRERCSPGEHREYVHDPIRFPTFPRTRSVLARVLRAWAAVVEPRLTPAPRLDSVVCRG